MLSSVTNNNTNNNNNEYLICNQYWIQCKTRRNKTDFINMGSVSNWGHFMEFLTKFSVYSFDNKMILFSLAIWSVSTVTREGLEWWVQWNLSWIEEIRVEIIWPIVLGSEEPFLVLTFESIYVFYRLNFRKTKKSKIIYTHQPFHAKRIQKHTYILTYEARGTCCW